MLSTPRSLLAKGGARTRWQLFQHPSGLRPSGVHLRGAVLGPICLHYGTYEISGRSVCNGAGACASKGNSLDVQSASQAQGT
jgi:hypothetical protein